MKYELEDSLAGILRPPKDQLVLSPEDPKTQDPSRVSIGSEWCGQKKRQGQKRKHWVNLWKPRRPSLSWISALHLLRFFSVDWVLLSELSLVNHTGNRSEKCLCLSLSLSIYIYIYFFFFWGGCSCSMPQLWSQMPWKTQCPPRCFYLDVSVSKPNVRFPVWCGMLFAF